MENAASLSLSIPYQKRKYYLQCFNYMNIILEHRERKITPGNNLLSTMTQRIIGECRHSSTILNLSTKLS
jgi:hypothetical protein